MGRRRLVLATLGLLALAGVTAAGVVAFAGRSAPESPTREMYVDEVRAICVEFGARLDKVPPPGDLSSPGSVVESLQAALPILQEQEDTVRALTPPPELRDDLDTFFRLTDRSLVELRTALDAALERALYPMATALTRFGDVRNDAKRVARSIGFDC